MVQYFSCFDNSHLGWDSTPSYYLSSQITNEEEAERFLYLFQVQKQLWFIVIADAISYFFLIKESKDLKHSKELSAVKKTI